MSTTVGDYIEGFLANRATNLAMVVLLCLILMVLEGGAPNRFITNSIIVIGAIGGWLLGTSYGKRNVYRKVAQNKQGKQ
ncbi:MAG: hypothetical protein ABEI86_10790 [Halobacteriaceae archaeon]